MNLTKLALNETYLRHFFRKYFVPMADKLRKSRIQFFANEPDEGKEEMQNDSWYVPYPSDTPELVQFDSNNLGEKLCRLWESQGLPQLADLAEPISILARRIEMPVPSHDADISPFIYVMF